MISMPTVYGWSKRASNHEYSPQDFQAIGSVDLPEVKEGDVNGVLISMRDKVAVSID